MIRDNPTDYDYELGYRSKNGGIIPQTDCGMCVHGNDKHYDEWPTDCIECERCKRNPEHADNYKKNPCIECNHRRGECEWCGKRE